MSSLVQIYSKIFERKIVVKFSLIISLNMCFGFSMRRFFWQIILKCAFLHATGFFVRVFVCLWPGVSSSWYHGLVCDGDISWSYSYLLIFTILLCSKTLSLNSKRTPKIGFQYQLPLNTGKKYCRMLQGEHSAILSTFIRLPFSI